MKHLLLFSFLFFSTIAFTQVADSTTVFKKPVLDSAEVDFVSSYYNQDGIHSAVSGGIGSEKLSDIASTIVVTMPLSDDEILTIDVGISAYTSASSSNINPFSSQVTNSSSGASKSTVANAVPTYGTPWQASSGASKSDQLYSVVANYSHSSDSRNFIWNADFSASNEFDYTSFGFGGGVTKLFNDKNSEVSVKLNAYLDQWRPIYPHELHEYSVGGNHYSGETVYDAAGNVTTNYLNSTSANSTSFKVWDSSARDSYAASFAFSQVLNKKSQFSVFFDLLFQQGMLSTPYQRIYFADKNDYYVGVRGDLVSPNWYSNILNYQNSSNTGIYRLADDIERLPGTRFKIPVGIRWHYFIDEKWVLRTYYRFYKDDWAIQSHTISAELPFKINDNFTVYPMFRYYTQGQSKFFAPFEKHLSTEQYYTSDYDLSSFVTRQYGFGCVYTDVFSSMGIFGLGIKNIEFRFNHYSRSDGLNANIGTLSFKFVTD